MNSILPNSIQQPHLIAFELLMKQRFDKIQLDALLVYLIDYVNETALYSLAQQFDLLGFNGWKLADTNAKKRALIKKGIELHRYKGTVWSIKEALKTVGFPDATITEHVTHWAGFTIQLNAGNAIVSLQQLENATEMVNSYKNVRSHLMGFEFKNVFSDDLFLSEDSFDGPGDGYDDGLFMGSDFIYNGDHQYDGTKNYNSDEDTLELIIS